MKQVVALILAGALVAPPASAGQKPGMPIAWEKAEKLKAGTAIFLTVTGGQPTKVRFLFADDTMLLTLNPARANLSPQVERTLVGIGAQWPAILQGTLTFDGGRVRVSKDGVFDRTQKVGDLAELTQQTPRIEVQAIAAPQEPGEPVAWEKAQKLKAGTEILLTVTGGQPTAVRFLFADDRILLTLNPARANVPSQVRRTLVAVGAQWPAVLDGNLTVSDNRVRVSHDGVFDGTQKVGELAELTQQTPRGDVLEVSEAAHRRTGLIVGIVLVSVFIALLVGREIACRFGVGCG